MSDQLKIPENLDGAFKRLMGRIPENLRDSRELQEKCLAYLKLGGFSLALQRLESACLPFMEELTMFKRHLREAPEEEEEESLDDDETTDTHYDDDQDDDQD